MAVPVNKIARRLRIAARLLVKVAGGLQVKSWSEGRSSPDAVAHLGRCAGFLLQAANRLNPLVMGEYEPTKTLTIMSAYLAVIESVFIFLSTALPPAWMIPVLPVATVVALYLGSALRLPLRRRMSIAIGPRDRRAAGQLTAVATTLLRTSLVDIQPELNERRRLAHTDMQAAVYWIKQASSVQ